MKHKQLGGSHRGKDTEKFQVHMIIYAKAFAIKKLDGVGSCNLHDPTPSLYQKKLLQKEELYKKFSLRRKNQLFFFSPLVPLSLAPASSLALVFSSFFL